MTEHTIIRAENRAKAVDLLGGVCVHCRTEGYSGLVKDRLEFDHIENDREDAQHCLSQMWSSSWDKILIELKKCQLLCRTCHAKKSQQDLGHDGTHNHGTLSTYVNLKCRCDECKGALSKYMLQYRRRIA
jgi:hypothetical protein